MTFKEIMLPPAPALQLTVKFFLILKNNFWSVTLGQISLKNK